MRGTDIHVHYRAFSGSDKWMSYIGLDQAPREPSSEDTCGINRSHVSYWSTCINYQVEYTLSREKEEVGPQLFFVNLV